MSSKKIIRLKTPTKLKECLKTPESTFAHTRFNVLDSLTEIQQQESADSIHLALINEVNKLYKEVEALKKKAAEEERINDELCREKKRLRVQIQLLEKEYASQREMYELERLNHQRLREFYELREKEWQQIVLQHRQMLEEYDHQHNTSLSDVSPEEQLLAIHSNHKLQAQQLNHFESQKQLPNKIEAKEAKKIKRLSLQNKLNTDKQAQGPQAYFITEISRLYTQEKQFAKKSQLRYSNSQSQNKGQTHRNPQADQLFDRVMRETYCCLKQQAKAIERLRESEDMVKLRQAKTSTRERLIKTVRKLEFQVKSERELLAFCDYVEQQVLGREKMLRGDLVCEFLIDKLQECEKLALSSNSAIEKMEASVAWQGGAEVQRASRENLELLLNSTIRQPPRAESAISQDIRYSISSLQNLSSLIHERQAHQVSE